MNEATHSTTVGVSANNSILSFGGGNITITVYSTQGGTGNQINFRSGCTLTLSVTYSEASTASTGTLNLSSVAVGSNITLSITTASSSLNHTVLWALGSFSQLYNLGAGVSSNTLTVPAPWLNAIPGTSAAAKVTLTTLSSGGSTIGSNTYTFTVTLPAGMSPSIGSFTATRIDGTVPSAWGVYVQGKSKVQLTIGGAAASTGASISTYKISGGGYSFSSATETSYTTGFLTIAETITFTASVTDSRGLTASSTVSVSVLPYSAPSITQVVAFRCAANGVASETGAYINVTCTAAFATVGGRNALALTMQYRQVGASGWSVATTVNNGVQATNNAGLVGTNLYELRVVAADSFSTVERIVDITAAQYTMHFTRGGLNVSIGKAGTRQNALEIHPDWKLYHGDTDVMAKLAEVRTIVYGSAAPSSPVEGMIWLKPAT